MEENKETCNKIDKISWSDNQKDLISEKNISETTAELFVSAADNFSGGLIKNPKVQNFSAKMVATVMSLMLTRYK